MKWIIILLITTAVIVSVIFIGLRSVSRAVIVTDPSGKPIAGAEVSGETATFNKPWIPTNANGRARLMDFPQEIWWIRVRKSGYKAIYTDAPAKWPFRVALTPSKPVTTPKPKQYPSLYFPPSPVPPPENSPSTILANSNQNR